MPRKLTPGALKTGSGKRAPEKGTTLVLGGAGISGPGPNIGSAEWMSLGGQKALPNWLMQKINAAGGGAAVAAHLAAQSGAHPARAISATGTVDGFNIDDVQEALLALHGALPVEPPKLGEWRKFEMTNFSGVTDWGSLKVSDYSLADRGALPVTVGATAAESVYPYFFKAPSPLVSGTASPFAQDGSDPQSDPEWNSSLALGVVMFGTGVGLGHTGGFTRDGTLANDELMRTAVIMGRSGIIDDVTLLPLRREVTISGALYPADRGVLALLHWPAGVRGGPPTINNFLAQSLEDRVIAALLVGQGVLSSVPCVGNECDDMTCDGGSGGIFAVGISPSGTYDPFAWPGRASGQYDLRELFTGVNQNDGSDLQDPFAGGVPVVRAFNGTVPAPGQVRLGTDPNASEADPTGYGIPILGANIIGYDLVSPPATLANVNAGTGRIGHVMVGNSVVREENPAAPGTYLSPSPNFFRYRLPYLKDYTPAGLKWTPQGDDYSTSRETFRFFDRASPSAAAGLLANAGNWVNPFTEDHIDWQVARYRHSFLLPSTALAATEQEVGTYWMVHFKKEADFEACVRDGIMPWDVTNGYAVYGVELFTTANIEADGNVVNEQLSINPWEAPFGFAPNYGYAAGAYHTLRSTVYEVPAPANLSMAGTFDWLVREPANSILWASGVAYFTPRRNAGGSAGQSNFEITDIQINEAGSVFFNDAFRTSDSQAVGNNAAPVPTPPDPALLSSMSPAFLTFFPFAYGDYPNPDPVDAPNGPSVNIPLNADTALGLSDLNSPRLPSRVEVPYTHMGPGGGGQFSESNGPLVSSSVDIGLAGGTNLTFIGDDLLPSFVVNAKLRAFFRRPTLHVGSLFATEPYSVTAGHGIMVPPGDDAEILLHTSRFDNSGGVGSSNGDFGNFVVAGAVPLQSYPILYNALKDTQERFLDEAYRYPASFRVNTVAGSGIHLIVGYGAAARNHLVGPGMALWGAGTIEVPVRAGLNDDLSLNWANDSWLPMNLHLTDFNGHGAGIVDAVGSGVVKGELQVKGWPDRNPPMTDRADAPYPSSGILVYPARDFSTVGSPNIRPSGPLGSSDIATEQPDYTLAGKQGLREYVRAFDASFAQSVNVVGQPFVTLRIDGVSLAELAYNAPGPGSLDRVDANANTYLAVMLKIPGLTTWMDIGRPDGAGPSKQDAFLDGAGCQVVGPSTFSAIDTASGVTYSQIRCNVGPIANLFANTGKEGTTVGEVPVLVKVMMRATAKNLDYAHVWDGTNISGLVPGAGSSYANVIGVSGIRLILPV